MRHCKGAIAQSKTLRISQIILELSVLSAFGIITATGICFLTLKTLPMIRKLLFASTLIILASFGMISCSKNDAVSQSENIVGTWQITGIQSNYANDWDGDGREETDIYSTYSTCDRDIEIVFEEGGYGKISEGCDAPYDNINWQLTNNRLDIQIPSGDLNLDITQLTRSSMKGNDVVQVDGRSVTITYSLTRR
jgi:hypothetical protein